MCSARRIALGDALTAERFPDDPVKPIAPSRFTRHLKRAAATLACVVGIAFLLDRLFPLPLPDPTSGSTVVLARDGTPLRAFPDDTVLELWKNGVLMLVQMHLVSLVNIRHLVNRKAARVAAARPPETAALRSNRQ